MSEDKTLLELIKVSKQFGGIQAVEDFVFRNLPRVA